MIPLVSKGRSEAETAAADINYFLGLDVTDPANPKIAADFEESQAGAIPGQNHPVVGSTSVTQNVWHHAAATYDGTTLRIYLDGNPEGSVGREPASECRQHRARGVGNLVWLGGFRANGFFGGLMDEARIWNTARTQGQIQASMNTPITSPTAGLLARYGLNEGTGTAVGDSIAPAENGTAQPTANAPSWAAGAPALDGDVTAPAAPTGLAATSGEGNVALNWNDNGEGDFAGYNVYRGTSSPVSTAGSPLNGGTPLGRLAIPRHDRHARHDLLLRGDGRGHLGQRVRRLERGQRLT